MRASRKLMVGVSTALLSAVTLLVAPVQAQTVDGPKGSSTSTPANPTQKIVGGSVSANGAWPSMAALLQSNVANNFQAQFCGGTVINPSWVLTAAHCIHGKSASQIDVLTGTQSLSSGGVRTHAVELREFPNFNADLIDGDYGLIRLADPTTAPVQSFVSQGQVVPAGTPTIVTGWGDLESGGGIYPTALNQTWQTLISNADCAASGYGPDISPQMICAGNPPAYTASDSCDGDSGGPLLFLQNGVWKELGIVSWGAGCADGMPGVYTRIAAQSDWIKAQIRFGPHTDATAFVRSSWRDLFAVNPTSAQQFAGVSALNSIGPATWLSQQIEGATYQGRMGGVARLYRAYFLRDPDTPGLAFWFSQINSGWSLSRISAYFAQSTEFNERYGSLTDAQYVDRVYQNVLGRLPDSSGRAFWVGQLASGAKNRGTVMLGFSESNEYKNANKARIDVIITFYALVRRAPSASDINYWISQSNPTLVSTLLNSLEYHSRF